MGSKGAGVIGGRSAGRCVREGRRPAIRTWDVNSCQARNVGSAGGRFRGAGRAVSPHSRDQPLTSLTTTTTTATNTTTTITTYATSGRTELYHYHHWE
ncbi:hypothetical protein E2C01_084387 [Portunus trituberculatus]|uniref:Uncharacterized protein n=1 Tax=Portunus trituberculatus TaxID=210409 RepID=A0A5B7IV60_PORTR|nr:hypothetical protein [Portunus trituberculatus]